LDYERTEFESLLNNKKKEIEDKDKMVNICFIFLALFFLLLLML
jgi:hypothetical protein